MVNVHVVGMSHVDLGFVMTEEEMEELLEILVERMLAVIDRHPDINYAIEQMLHYKKLAQRRPDLLERMQAYIRNGRIDVMGAMASTMETNFPSGEAFVRNQMIGLNWAKKELSVCPQSGWLVDTFGLNPQIPQILRQFGFDHLFANRFGGDKKREIFEAEGLDGSKILVIGNDLASVNNEGKYISFRLCRSWSDLEKVFSRGDALTGEDVRLVSAYIENEEVLTLHYKTLTERRRERPGENWFLSSYHAFVEDLKKAKKSFPVVNADLNPEFTGTFALRTPLKTLYRKTETRLLEIEKWKSLIGNAADSADFEDAWWKMSFVQFHDVFTGSHGDETFRNVQNKLASVNQLCGEQMELCVGAITGEDPNSFVCLNGVPWERDMWIAVPKAFEGRRIWMNGCELPVVSRDEGDYCRVKLPPAGLVSLCAGKETARTVGETADCCCIQNEYHQLSVDPTTGALTVCLEDGTILVEQADDYLVAQEDVGGFQIESPVGGEVFACGNSVKVSPVLRDAMGEKITISGEFPSMQWNRGENRLKWRADFSVEYGNPGIRFRLTLDWAGEGTRIRLNFPTTIDRADAVYEVPFGTVKRSAYRPRPTAKGEWPAQRFVTLEDEEKGLALLNTGVAGVEVSGKTLSTTLIRAYYPGPMAWVPPTSETSQHGIQTFDFMIVPYRGGWSAAGVGRLAQELNVPPVFVEKRSMQAASVSLMSVEPANIVVSAVKPANDGSGEIILRIYENEGRETEGHVYVNGAIRANLCSITEEIQTAIQCSDGQIVVRLKPFEIQSIRIRRG